MINFSKKIANLRVYKNLNSNANSVYGIAWILEAEENGVVAQTYMYTSIPQLGTGFIRYEDLTEDLLLSWIDTFTPETYMAENKARVQIDLEDKKTKDTILPYWIYLQNLQAAEQQAAEEAAAAQQAATQQETPAQ